MEGDDDAGAAICCAGIGTRAVVMGLEDWFEVGKGVKDNGGKEGI
jgi:hypothetical protein